MLFPLSWTRKTTSLARTAKSAEKKDKRSLHTRERILKTALTLFNTEGEQSVGLVDVAGEMGISPGNLYYHYKGKEPLIEALFDAFEEEITTVLYAPADKPLELEDNWIFLYIIFEEIFDFRFFYLNLASILDRVPSLGTRFERLIRAKQATMLTIVVQLESEGLLIMSDEQKRLVSRRSALLFTYWLPQAALTMDMGNPAHVIHEGVYTIFSQLTPYMGTGAEEFETLLKAFHERVVSG